MTFPYKIAAFDLDGTLTRSKQPLEEDMAKVLFELAKKIPVVIISGGSKPQFDKQIILAWKKFVPQEPKINKNIILLATSGTQDYEYDEASGSWEGVYEAPFSEETRKKIIKVLEEIIASGEYDIPLEHSGPYIEDRGTQVTLSACGQDAPTEVKQSWDPTHIKRRKIKLAIEVQIPNLEISFGGMNSIDILPKGFTKAIGLRRLLERKGLHDSDLIFVGDSLFPDGNDRAVLDAGFKCTAVSGPQETIKVIQGWSL